MNKTDIEYLDYSWNVTHGCSPVSAGCNHCWAKATSKRLASMGVQGYSKDDPFAVTCCPWKLDEPLKIKKPSRIGVSFMGDLFHEDVPDNFISEVFDIMGRQAAQHQYVVLTKRSDRMKDWINQAFGENDPYPNIIGMVTAENQDQADKRIPDLLQSRFAIRGVSIEPMLGAVKLAENNLLWDYNYEEYVESVAPPSSEDIQVVRPKHYRLLDWVIVGAESGPKRRYCENHWVRQVVEQCKSAGVPVFVKQLQMLYKKSRKKYATWLSKNMDEWPEDLRVREYPG